MPTNPNVLIDREKYIGGSEIAAILNISPFKSRWELLQEKAGITIEKYHAVEYEEYGQKMESKIRDYINKKYSLGFKEPFYESTITKEHDVIDLRCNYDGINSEASLEIKTTSQIHNDVRDYKYYVVQLLWGMMLGKLKKGILAVYHRPDDFNEEFDEKRLQIFEINIKDFKDWIEEIEEAVKKFCVDLARLKENPFLQEEDFLPNDIVSSANMVLMLENQLQFYNKMQERYENEKTRLMNLMIKNGCKSWQTPNGVKITVILGKADEEVKEEYYNEEKFIEENSELHEEYHNKLAEYKEIRTVLKKGRKDSLRITIPKNKYE